MKEIVASVLINRPPEAIWKFVTDWSNNPKWDTDSVETKQTSPGPVGVGTTFQFRRSTSPKIQDGRVLEYKPNQKFAFEFTSGPGKGSRITMSLEAVEGKTRFTETDDYKIGGFYKLLVPFMGGQAKRNAEARVGNVKRILESEAKS